MRDSVAAARRHRTTAGRPGQAPAEPFAGEHGAAAVEFALVSPLLFLLLFGTVQYGFVFSQMQSASAVALTTARWASTGITDCTAFEAAVRDLARGNGLPAGGAGWRVTTSTSTLPSNPGPTPDLASVSVSFDPPRYLPLVPFPQTVTRSAVVRIEDTSRAALSCPDVTP